MNAIEKSGRMAVGKDTGHRDHPFHGLIIMKNVEITKIEEQLNGRLLYSVRAYDSSGRIEFPVGIQDLGTPALDEIAVLRSTLTFADELAASIRLRLALL